MPHKRWSHAASSGFELARDWSRTSTVLTSFDAQAQHRFSDSSPRQFRQLIASLSREPSQLSRAVCVNSDDVNSPRKLGYMRSLRSLPALNHRDVTTQSEDPCASGVADSHFCALNYLEEVSPSMKRPQHRPWMPLSVVAAYE